MSDPNLVYLDGNDGEKMIIPASFVLMSAAKHIASNCNQQNYNFLVCKRNDEHPEKCLAEGTAVRSCTHGVVREVYKRCPSSFLTFAGCMSDNLNRFEHCKPQQAEFEKCLSESQKK
eukprot:c15767_g1_i1.p1 GENE.c15767_g1_i1~~c15767_g1_i1.p1  ORF type:complete len:117 (+),score=38.29 c15767_g1_i1:89-439(+)